MSAPVAVPGRSSSLTMSSRKRSFGTNASPERAESSTGCLPATILTAPWERTTGRPIHNAIVWQDRRTADTCAALRQGGHEPLITARTGLVLDPYFSATKIAWLLDHVEGARAAAQKGRLAFGTVDSFLLWRLTGGRVHATDATNAARTLLMDIHSGDWDAGLCELFGVPNALLPPIRDCAGDFGTTDLFGGPIRILGLAGDQQAATVGQGCFAPGMMKSTYGTGCFALLAPSPTNLAESAPTRSKARSSSPGPRCNGCATRSR